MPTYYITQQGLGIESGENPDNPMSLDIFHQTEFTAGDIVLFSGLFTDTISIDSGGTSNDPVIYKGTNDEFIDDDTHAEVIVDNNNHAIIINTKHVLIENFSASNLSSENYSCFAISGDINNSQDADDSIHLRDCTAVENNGNGDGFSIISSPESTTKATFTRCQAKSITGPGDQGFTNHNNQKSFLIDCSSTSDCQLPIGCVGESVDIVGGIFRNGGAGSDIIYVDGETTLTATDATFIAEGSGSSANIFSKSPGELNKIVLNNCSIHQNDSARGINYLDGLPGSGLYMNGGEITIDSEAPAFIMTKSDEVTVHIDNVYINVLKSGAKTLISNSNSEIVIENSTIDYSNSTLVNYYFIHGGSGFKVSQYSIANNTFYGNPNAALLNTHPNTKNSYAISGNHFRDFTGMTPLIDNRFNENDTGSLLIKKNIFENTNTVISNNQNTILDDNQYINSTNNFPDDIPTETINSPFGMVFSLLIILAMIGSYSARDREPQ